nr:hypothetical protein [candidate division Zixibacteria bacterium]
MPLDKKVQEALAKKLRQEMKLMDVEEVKKDLVEWLEQIPFPNYPGAASWADCIKTFPAKPEEQQMESGMRLRVNFRLYTDDNEYLVSFLESLNPNSRGKYILTVHVNWQKQEKQIQEQLETIYFGKFDDGLKAKHTIWAQTIEKEQIRAALDSCAIAILGNELQGEPSYETAGIPIKIPQVAAKFPSSDD